MSLIQSLGITRGYRPGKESREAQAAKNADALIRAFQQGQDVSEALPAHLIRDLKRAEKDGDFSTVKEDLLTFETNWIGFNSSFVKRLFDQILSKYGG